MSKIVTDEDFYKEVKSDGTEYKTPKEKRIQSYNYYHKNKERIKDENKHKYMTDPEYRARVAKIKKKNRRAMRARERARKEGIAPYLVNINNELVVVNMCTIRGLAIFLGRKKKTVTRWMENKVIPKGIYRNKKHHHLYTEMQAFFMKSLIDNEEYRTISGGISHKILKEKTFEFWEKWPYGFDLDDLKFEVDNE